MRVFGIFLTVLFLGISSTAIARKLTAIGHKLIHSQSAFSHILLASSPEMSTASAKNFIDQLERKCERNGGPTAYKTLRRNLNLFPKCLASALNMEQLQDHISAALRHGEFNSIFKEYCGKVPDLMQCISKGSSSFKPCLEPEEQEALEISNNVTNSLLQFLCQDDGDRIALFVAEGGVTCLASNKEVLMNCISEAFDKRPQPVGQQEFFRFPSGPEECADIETLRMCTASVMQTCSNPSPARVMDSVFDFYKREKSCEAITEQPTTPAEAINATEIWTPTTPRSEFIPDEEDTLEGRIRRKCEKNGGSMAYGNFKENAQLVLNTYGLVANSSQISDELSSAAPGDGMVNVVKKYCHRAPILKGLIEFASDSMKHCLGPVDRRSLEIIHKIRSSMLEFVCHNGGERISTFVDSGGIDCLGYRGDALLNCASQSFSRYSSSTFSIAASALGLDNLEVPYIDADGFYADVDQFRDCALEALGRCGDRTTNVNLLTLAVDLINKKIPCRNISKETETPAPAVEITTTTTAAPEVVPTTEDAFEALSNLEYGIKDLSDFHTIRTVSHNVLRQYLREKCELNRGPSVYEAARVMPYYVSKYVNSMMLNLRRFQFESIPSDERDKVDVFFKKFCAKHSTVEDSVERLGNFSQTCPGVLNLEMVEIVYNTTRAFQEFLCRDDGERLASFAAAGGLRCWASRVQDVEGCVAHYFPTDPRFLYDVCYYHFRRASMCFVSNLGQCEENAEPAMIEALIHHVIDEAPCRDRLRP